MNDLNLSTTEQPTDEQMVQLHAAIDEVAQQQQLLTEFQVEIVQILARLQEKKPFSPLR